MALVCFPAPGKDIRLNLAPLLPYKPSGPTLKIRLYSFPRRDAPRFRRSLFLLFLPACGEACCGVLNWAVSQSVLVSQLFASQVVEGLPVNYTVRSVNSLAARPSMTLASPAIMTVPSKETKPGRGGADNAADICPYFLQFICIIP